MRAGWYTFTTDEPGVFTLYDGDVELAYNLTYASGDLFTYKLSENKTYTLKIQSEKTEPVQMTLGLEKSDISRVEFTNPSKTTYTANIDKYLNMTGLTVIMYNSDDEIVEKMEMTEDDDMESMEELNAICNGEKNADGTFKDGTATVTLNYKGETHTYTISVLPIPLSGQKQMYPKMQKLSIALQVQRSIWMYQEFRAIRGKLLM